MKGRILAVDPGGRRVGLALSDPLQMIASPFRTLLVSGEADAIQQIRTVIADEQVVELVVGIPQRAGGEESQQAQSVAAFIEKLQVAVQIPVHAIDESFTSVEAEEALHQMGKRIGQDKGAVDRIAASLILKAYLENRGDGDAA